jgi:hypothetical protein
MFIFTAASACTLHWFLIIIRDNHFTWTVIVNVEHIEQSIKIYQRPIVLFIRIKRIKTHFIFYHEISHVSITKIDLTRRKSSAIWQI